LPDLISRRHVDFANASSNELEQLAHACCEPTSFGLNDEDILDETYHKTTKVDSDVFSTQLVLEQTDLVKAIREYFLEGTYSARNLNVELYKLKVYGMCLSL